MMLTSQIPDDAPQDQIFQLDDNHFVRTGNLVPEEKPANLATVADRMGILTRDQIAKILADPNRRTARQRFPVSWIKNQGRRGSCNAYAACAAAERARDFRRLPRVVLGPEYLYAQINGGKDRGSQLDKGMRAMVSGGCPPKEFVRYESYLKSQQSPEAIANAPRFRILEPYAIHSAEELATALALNFPCVVACHVTDNWMKLDAQGVVYRTDGEGNHAICLDDLRINSRGEYEFDHAGSWSARYGQEGRGWTSWDKHYRTPSRYHQFYAVRSTIDDPQGDVLAAA